MASKERIAAYDVFVSYSSKDAGWVHDTLVRKLTQAKLKVAVDRAFSPGPAVALNVERAISESRHVILVLTPNWLSSDWTRFEHLLALHQDPGGVARRVLPVLLQSCDLPLRLRILTYLDLRSEGSQDMQLDRLVATIRESDASTSQAQLEHYEAPTICAEFSWTRGLQNSKVLIAARSPDARAVLATLEARLRSNLLDERMFGTNEGLRSDRSRIVDELNRLALAEIDATFTDLCMRPSS